MALPTLNSLAEMILLSPTTEHRFMATVVRPSNCKFCNSTHIQEIGEFDEDTVTFYCYDCVGIWDINT